MVKFKRWKHKKPEKEMDSIWLAFSGFMFVGLGLGILYRETAAGLLVGMGAGFLAVALLSLKYRN